MPIRVTGMNSGLDTESIISQLVSAKSAKKTSMVKSQTKLSWKMDAWKTLNSKIYNLYTGKLSSMRFSSAYTKKKTTVSNPSIATVAADPDAVNGTQTLKVNSLAKSGYLTGESLTDESGEKTNYTKATKLSDVKGLESLGNASFTLKTGGKSTDIDLTGASTIGDVISKLKDAGVNANFDENYQRFFISSTTTGKDADFSLTANNADGFQALSALGINVMDEATAKEYGKLANMTEEQKAAYIDSEVAKRAAKANDAMEKAQKTIDENQENLNKFFELADDPYYVQSDMDTAEKLQARKEELEAEKERLSTVPEDETAEAKQEREALLKQTNSRLDNITKLSGFAKNIEDAQASIDKNAELVDNDNAKIKEQVTAELDSKIAQAQDAILGKGFSTGAVRIQGKDAQIELNGAVFESKNNTFAINGLTITATQESAEEVTLTTGNDYDGFYDTVKNFLKEYNELVNEMDKLYNAESSKGYDPLTSEEKSAMSEDEVKEWEKKIKDSILRKDESLNTISQAMYGVMSGGVKMGDKTVYLSDFGINTLGYFTSADNEKHAYHIDGDKDDSNVANNTDKLMAAIMKDPDNTLKFFQKLSQNLYDTMTKKMASSSMSSAYTAYNDKKMKDEYKQFTSDIATEEDRIKDYEDKWYKKFGAMETALAKLSSKTSAMSGLFGG